MGEDDEDGADDCTPAYSGAGTSVVVMRIIRVRARPSRSKPISMPILRRKVAARRSRPDSARGLSGQVLDLATRSTRRLDQGDLDIQVKDAWFSPYSSPTLRGEE
jgi:hypothetical protein